MQQWRKMSFITLSHNVLKLNFQTYNWFCADGLPVWDVSNYNYAKDQLILSDSVIYSSHQSSIWYPVLNKWFQKILFT